MSGESDAIGQRARATQAVLALAGALIAGPAMAMHTAPDNSATPAKPARHLAFGGFFESPDSARGADSGLGANYGYGSSFWGSRAWELRLFTGTLETGVAGKTDFYQYGAGADLFQYFGDTSRGHPYAVVGAGAVNNDVDPDELDGVSGYVSAGLGWRGAPWKGWGIRHRLDLRAVYDSFESGQTDVLFGLTLEIPAEREKIVVQEKRVEVEKIVEVVREVPAPVVVAPDADADSIPDALDQCPDTVSGAKVEADGCVRREQVVALPNIEFAYEKAELTGGGRETLGQVVRFMNDQPEITLEVWGHTDAKGAELYNLHLSEKRAAAVVKYLVDSGIAAGRMKSAGFGESRPLADNETEEGRERNRRVELHIRATGAAGG
jgi:OOP family OmpA-OmpF porin